MHDTAPLAPLDPEPPQAAEIAGLTYVSDNEPGIRRRRSGKVFRYLAPDGSVLRDPRALDRIRRLAIPPAWTDVWISPDPDGHLQATGRDQRGRKQYRYHARWREVRDESKYGRMIAFGRALPRIRERVEADLKRPGLPREKVLATIVRLLETTLMRVGNDEYRRRNDSYGATTLEDRHVEITGATLRFEFRAKSGKVQRIALRDRRLARIVKSCQDIPGQVLFQYVDEDGQRRAVGSADVNAYLQEIAGESFTAKDFRTWAGTVLAALALGEFEAAEGVAAARRNVRLAIERVAQRLGNTVAICRKCYVHPEVVDCYLDGTLAGLLVEPAGGDPAASAGLDPQEAAVLALLARRLAGAAA